MSQIQAYFKDITFGQSGYVVVYTPDMQPLYYPSRIPESSVQTGITPLIDPSMGQNTLFVNGAMITYTISKDSGFVYAAYIPLSEVVAPALQVRNATVVLLAASLALSFLYMLYVSKWLFSPIHTLVEHMGRAGEGQTDIQITEQRHDEMGVLFSSFNRMIRQIDQLMHKLYLQEILSKELQLENLQIQLNPHFLYNTLDAIHWAARENSMDEVCQMTFMLSRYFRRNLSDGRTFITVEDAANTVESYIAIQRMRFEHRFQFAVHVDEDARRLYVPKYLFQPLVENAILHGMEKREGPGRCDITFRIVNDQFEFCVQDDGMGIAPQKLEELRAALHDPEPKSGNSFALRNINMQLKLYYGAAHPLHIESEWGGGCRIWFRIPKEALKEDV